MLATSFINEHSVEFYIVPYLKNELEKSFKYVAPVFPWLNRETSKISKILHGNDRFHILVVFPRRPKLTINDSKEIFITINSEVLEFKNIANQYDIPIILSCPIASNFWELSKCSNFVWLEINDQQPDEYLKLVQSSNFNKLSLPSI